MSGSVAAAAAAKADELPRNATGFRGGVQDIKARFGFSVVVADRAIKSPKP
jgi:hypothetical protein